MLHSVGAVEGTFGVESIFPMILGQRSLSSSPTGSPATLEDMLAFVGRHKLTPVVETFKMDQINDAFEKLRSGSPRFPAGAGAVTADRNLRANRTLGDDLPQEALEFTLRCEAEAPTACRKPQPRWGGCRRALTHPAKTYLDDGRASSRLPQLPTAKLAHAPSTCPR